MEHHLQAIRVLKTDAAMEMLMLTVLNEMEEFSDAIDHYTTVTIHY